MASMFPIPITSHFSGPDLKAQVFSSGVGEGSSAVSVEKIM